MTIGKEILYAKLDDLLVDPNNPRLGRNNTGPSVSQVKVMEFMRDWNLEELAVSFLESGFWPQEALLVAEEKLYGKSSLVVVEGNHRVAALKYLRDAINGKPASKKWEAIADGAKPPVDDGSFDYQRRLQV